MTQSEHGAVSFLGTSFEENQRLRFFILTPAPPPFTAI